MNTKNTVRPGYYFCGTALRILTSPADLESMQEGVEVTYFDTMSDGIRELVYRGGHGKTILLIKGGKLIAQISSSDGYFPILTESPEKCLVDEYIHHTSSQALQQQEELEWNWEFQEAAQRLGMLEKYIALEKQGEHQDLHRKICAEVYRHEADARAKADKSGILRRLLTHYRNGRNPLRSLRAEKGGVWTFHAKKPQNLPANSQVFEGENWWVVWTP